MLKRLIAIAVIFCGASVAWMILGATLMQRTNESGDTQLRKLSAEWGSSQTQRQPSIVANHTTRIWNPSTKSLENRTSSEGVPLGSSRVAVVLGLTQRSVGLLWYNLYTVAFDGRYVVRNRTESSHLTLQFPYSSTKATYSDFTCTIGGRSVGAANPGNVDFELAPGKSTTIAIAYRSRGIESWQYSFGDGVQSVRDLDVTIATDFGAIDYPPSTLSPTSEVRNGAGWRDEWKYGSIATGNGIGIAVPIPMQPGPLAQRITMWAPLALLFYIFVMLVLTTLRNIDMHPVNYFFLASSFFAFHLLFAYLVDRIPLWGAFAICSCVTLFLTISYLRLVVGLRFAAVESGIAQLVYLILFSYALFNEGWSGLSITIGVILTLFVVMQVTARIKWSERFA